MKWMPHISIPALFCILTTLPCLAAAAGPDMPALVESLKAHMAEGAYDALLAEGMPAYRRLARRKYEVDGIHVFARNMAVVNRASRETLAVLTCSGAALDDAAFYATLTAAGRVASVPPRSLQLKEKEFLALLHTAMIHECHARVLGAWRATRNSGARNYVFAYLLAVRGAEDADVLAGEMPEELLTPDAVQALVRYCGKVGRGDVAGRICMEAADRSQDESAAIGLYEAASKHYLALKDVANAVAPLKTIVQRFPANPRAPDTQLQIIDLLSRRWRSYSTAAQECRVFLERFPDSDQAKSVKFRIGHLYYQDKDYQRALDYLKALAQEPGMESSHVPIQFLVAFCHMGQGEVETARDMLERLIEKNPKHPLAPRMIYVLAKTWLTTQEYDRARDQLERLLAVYPNSEYTRQAQDLVQRLSRVSAEKDASGAKPSDKTD